MNILFLRHSAGFEHSYLSDAEVALKAIGKENGWRVLTTHRLDRISAENLEKFDILAFATTGNLSFSDEQKTAILDFVRNGKSFLGIHNATDTCYDWPEYGEMLGGWFNGHPWHQEVGIIVEDTNHPATKMLGDYFRVTDEIYTFKNYDRNKTHVLMRIDNETVDLKKATAKITITPWAGATNTAKAASCTPPWDIPMPCGTKTGFTRTSRDVSNGRQDWRIRLILTMSLILEEDNREHRRN